jgi:hypothetical protein
MLLLSIALPLASCGRIGYDPFGFGGSDSDAGGIDAPITPAGDLDIVVLWSGANRSGFGRYDREGTLVADIVLDAVNARRRGAFLLPGGIVTQIPGGPGLSMGEFIGYDGGAGTGPVILDQSAMTRSSQAITRTDDGFYMVPNYDSTLGVSIHDDTGAFVRNFGSGGEVNLPFMAIELRDHRIIVASTGQTGVDDGGLVEYVHDGADFTYVGPFDSDAWSPFGMDYCEAEERLLVSELIDGTVGQVHSCTLDGVCTPLTAPGLGVLRTVAIDRNASDCSFFVSYSRTMEGADGKIARYNADGSLDVAEWTVIPNGGSKVYAMLFSDAWR